jgi:hypothetical protein
MPIYRKSSSKGFSVTLLNNAKDSKVEGETSTLVNITSTLTVS